MARRKPPKRRVRKKSNIINLEEYCLKKINESPLSKEFFYEHLDKIIKDYEGYGTKESLEDILEYMNLYHPKIVLKERGLI